MFLFWYLKQLGLFLPVGTVPCPLSDFHHFIHAVFKITKPRTTSRKLFYRSYKHFDPINFANDLKNAPFHVGEVLDINTHMEFFQKMFLDILDQHAPIKSKVIKTSQCPHMTKEWKTTIFRRNMALNKYHDNKTKKNFETFRKLQNKCSNLSKSALKQYFSKNCAQDNTEKPKHFWKVVKPFFSRKTKGTDTIQLEVDGKIISDPSEVANVFNDYFLNVANSIGNNSQYAKNVENHPSFRTIQDHVQENDIPLF